MKAIITICLLTSVIVLLVPGITEARTGSDTLVLIANSSVSDASLSRNDVKLVYLGKKIRWDDGQRIRPATLKEGPAHKHLLSEYVHKTPMTFKVYWRRTLMTCTGIPPKEFDTEADLIEYVAKTKGAIGYVSTRPGNAGIKIVRIKGRGK